MLRKDKNLSQKSLIVIVGGLLTLGVLSLSVYRAWPLQAAAKPVPGVSQAAKAQVAEVLALSTAKPAPALSSRSGNTVVPAAVSRVANNPRLSQPELEPPICHIYDACGAQPIDPAEDLIGGQGITGQITIGPVAPVCYVDLPQTCADAPYQTTMLVKNDTGTEITRFSSKADGTFKVSLLPGTYVVESFSQNSPYDRYPNSYSQTVTVLPGRYTYILISFDSGIR